MDSLITLVNELLIRIEKIENENNILKDDINKLKDIISNKKICNYCNEYIDINSNVECYKCNEKCCPNCVILKDEEYWHSCYERTYCKKCINIIHIF